ncbi:glycosyltransferase family 39 protein [Mycetocola manganoxydans]|nr:glycosyltransferase family 39 protein [Mycetocola manganoxydans]
MSGTAVTAPDAPATATADAGRFSRSRLTASVLFWIAFGLVIVAQLWVIVPGFTVMRLWEDEAFNLTVPINLLNGLGYTSDGTLSGSQLAPFDPRISTGPVVLLPIAAVLALGVDPVIGGRAVMLLFYAALLVGLWLLGRRIAGRWAGLVAVTVPLGLNTWDSASPIQTPIDILGEVPTAAFIVWALYVYRTRPWLAGLLVGLALESKAIGLLAVPAIAVGAFFTVPGSPLLRRFWRVLFCGVFALVPILLVELWKILALGFGGWVNVTREFWYFLRSGGQGDAQVAPASKMIGLFDSWFSPVPLTVSVVAAFIAVGVLVLVLARRRMLPIARQADLAPERNATSAAATEASARELLVLLSATLVGLATWLGWWMVSSHLPVWIRHPSPGLFACVPVLAAFFVLGIRLLWRATPALRAWRMGLRAVAVAASVLLATTLVVQVRGHIGIADHVRYGETLGAQRAAAAEIAGLGEEQFASSWGPEISVVVLSGARAALTDAPGFEVTTRVYANYDRSEAGLAAFETALESACADIPLRTGVYAVCVPG